MLAKYRYDDQGERKKRQTAAGDAWYVNQYFALLPNNMPTKHIFAGETRIATKTDAINMQTPLLNFYHSDHLGTTGYTTVASQNLVQHERYFAYGELWRGGGEQEESDLKPRRQTRLAVHQQGVGRRRQALLLRRPLLRPAHGRLAEPGPDASELHARGR